MHENTAPALRIRDLMPRGFVGLLVKATGITDPAAISKLVNLEQTTYTGWSAVVKLAQETNPQGFAQWEAAHQVAA